MSNEEGVIRNTHKERVPYGRPEQVGLRIASMKRMDKRARIRKTLVLRLYTNWASTGMKRPPLEKQAEGSRNKGYGAKVISPACVTN